MIFKTFNSDIDKWTAKIGIFGKSFNELGTAVNNAFNATIDNINNFDENIGFWESLKNNLFSKKDGDKNWIKNSLGEIISKENIDSYIKELDLNSAKEKLQSIFDHKELVDSNQSTWFEFFDGLKDDEQYLVDTIKNTNDLSKLTGEDLVQANQKARASAIAHNAALKQQTLGAKAAAVGMKALSVVGNTLAFMAISKGLELVAKTVYDLANSEENMRQLASELGEELSSSADSVEDYKTKIEELKSVINDSSSSFDAVSQARVDLMKIQDELIDKFGAEKGAIESITESINGQTDALDELSRHSYYEAKNKFNKKNMAEQFIDWLDLTFLGDANNSVVSKMDEMVHAMEFGDTGYHLETSGNKKLDSLISKMYDADTYEENGKEYFVLSGNMEELQEKLFGIQEIASNFEVSEDFEKSFTNISNEVDDLIEKNKELYDQQILWEKILDTSSDNQYDEQFNLIKKAKEAYNEALKSNDEESVKNAADAYAKTVSAAMDLANKNNDSDVADYFESMYPELQQIVGGWRFNLNFEPNTNGLQDNVIGALDSIDGVSDGKTDFSIEDIQNFNPNIATKEQIDAYGELNNVAYSYGLTIEQLIALLQEMGLVQSESYHQFVDTFGQENINKLSPEDLKIAYTIENVGNMTFEELQEEIRQTKKEIESPLSKSGLISQLTDLSDGFEIIDKIYADVKDGAEFDFTNLDDKKFADSFEGLKEEYTAFIEKISASPNDIKVAQSAFNDLITSWINSKGFLDQLNGDTAQVAIDMLSNYGIENAADIISEKLKEVAAANQFLAETGLDVTNATNSQVLDFLQLDSVADDTKYHLSELYLQNLNLMNMDFTTQGIQDQILQIASSCDASGDKVAKLAVLLQSLAKLQVGLKNVQLELDDAKSDVDIFTSNAKIGGFTGMIAGIQAEANSLLNSGKKVKYGVKYSGGKETRKDEAKAEKDKKDTKETFNWIEPKLNLMSDALDKIKTKADDTYSSWISRNTALQQSIGKTQEAIDLQYQAYNRYMQQANSVGLSDTYKSLVQNGALDIQSISDENLKERIKEYETYWDKAQECLKTQDDLQNSLKELDSQRFDNLKSEYDAITDKIGSQMDLIQGQIDLLEMKGLFANESYYNNMLSLTQNELNTLRQERSQLQAILNNTLAEQGSEKWNSMYATLLDLDSQIQEATNNLTEFSNAIRDINWEIFEYLENSISRITDETGYLIDLLANEDLYDDNGNLTKYADATIGLHAAAYDTYKQQAQDYYEEVQDLQRQLVNGAGKDVLEQYNEMVDAHQDAVLAMNDEKSAILDLIEEGYNAQLDALQKLIDKKKEEMNIERDLFSYRKSIEEKTKNISSLEKQQLVYEGDDSEEAMSKVQQIKVQLEEAKADLKETEYEQQLKDTEIMLDNLALEYEAWMNERLDNEDALLSEIIGTVSGKGDEINATLNEVANTNGTMISDTITSIFSADSPFTSTLTTGINGISTGIAGTTNAINNLIQKVSDITNILNRGNAGSGGSGGGSSSGGASAQPTVVNTPQPSSPSPSPASNVPSSNSGWGSWFIHKSDSYPKEKLKVDTSIVDRLKWHNFDSSFSARAGYYSAMGGSGTYTGSASQNTFMISEMKKHGFKKGGVIGDLINSSGEDGFVLARKGEGILPLDMMPEWEKFISTLPQLNNIDNLLLNMPKIPDFSMAERNSASNMNVGDIHVNMELPNVKDYEDFRNQLIKDNTFEKAMFTSINHALTGKGSSLDKLKYSR